MDILRIQSICGKRNLILYYILLFFIKIIVTFNNCKPDPNNLSTCLIPTLCKENSVHITLAVRAFFRCKHSQPNTWMIYSLSSRDCTDRYGNC